MIDVFLNWQMGNASGWGILGRSLFCHWANDPDVRPLMGRPIADEDLAMCDPLRPSRTRHAAAHSNRVLAGLRAAADGTRRVDAVVVDSLVNGLAPSNVVGTRNIARCIFEHTDLVAARANLERYDDLLVASHWNAALLEQATGRRPEVIFEGVDPSVFCPAAKSGMMDPDRFYVFSGGKVEYRKGHDLTLLAFRAFHARHPDAVLVAAWHSPWPDLSLGFRGRLTAALETGPDGALDFASWVHRNGIDPGSMIEVGYVPNALMPFVLREMDVALQPSRAEACTNLPAKEAMACGVPVIAARNTGMLDLLTDDNCIPLRAQASVERGGSATVGWGESDVDEIVEALELAYQRREEARRIGLRSREWLIEHGRTWQAHAEALRGWILART